MELTYRTVLFDLDGTVFESGEGIMRTAVETMEKFSWPVPPPETLRRFVGPPSHESYEHLAGMPRELAQRAAVAHRARYLRGNWRLARMYPGMRELLSDLRAAGARLAVASTKPRPAMEAMMEEFSLWDAFDAFSCGNADGTGGEKPVLIAKSLAALGEDDKSRAVMVGDTRFDAAGARDAGVPFIGALYGYGTREELLKNGASVFAESVGELRPLLFRGI